MRRDKIIRPRFPSGIMIAQASEAPLPTPVTWDPLNKDSHITLSSGNLTYGIDQDIDGLVRATASASSGKKYWEVTVTTCDAPSNVGIGISVGTATLGTWCGSSSDTLGWTGGGPIYTAGAPLATVASWVAGDTLCFALDITAKLLWVRNGSGNWNNDASADPASGALGKDLSGMSAPPWFPTGQGHHQTDSFTANFGGSTYAQSVPSGFDNW